MEGRQACAVHRPRLPPPPHGARPTLLRNSPPLSSAFFYPLLTSQAIEQSELKTFERAKTLFTRQSDPLEVFVKKKEWAEAPTLTPTLVVGGVRDAPSPPPSLQLTPLFPFRSPLSRLRVWQHRCTVDAKRPSTSPTRLLPPPYPCPDPPLMHARRLS